MTHAEQKKMIQELEDYEHKMKRNEYDEFTMFVKRNKDDEDLDKISLKKLVELHTKYCVNRGR